MTPKRSSVDFLGISDEDWERGITLDRWARQRAADAYQVASQNPLFILMEEPALGYMYFNRKENPDEPNEIHKHVAANRRLRDLLLDDLNERRCVLGVPPQSAIMSASPVSFHALSDVIMNINWGIGFPKSCLGAHPLKGKMINLLLFGPDTFGGGSDKQAQHTIKVRAHFSEPEQGQAINAGNLGASEMTADDSSSPKEPLPIWWPRTAEIQIKWRELWAKACELESKPHKWNVLQMATKLAEEELGLSWRSLEVEKRARTFRKRLGKMRKEGGPPAKEK